MNVLDLAYSLSIGPHYLYHKLVTGKYGPHVGEKTGRVPDRFRSAETAVLGTGNPHHEQPCLWLHAVSVGEAIASVDLARMIRDDSPRWDFRVSTTTATGRAIAEKNWGADSVFYYPLDFSWMVKRTFDNVRPNLIVLMELEIWPNFLREAVRRRVPVVVANARITERSVKRLRLVPSVAKNMATAVEAWFAQTEEYAERLRSIGVPANRIEVTGSVKYDAVPETIDDAVGNYYRRLFRCSEEYHNAGGDTLVVAGSTHPTEEQAILQAVRAVPMENGRRRVTVLAPRHPERLDEVEKMASFYGRVARRSHLREPGVDGGEDADIVLVDTMGELAKIYAAADVVVVGGTFIRHGGQNFMEPCGLGRPTLVGPNLWNFQEPADLLRKAEGILVVADGNELPNALCDLLHRPAAAESMGRRAREALLRERGAARRMADRIGVLTKLLARRER
ncbi:MAG: hypothetical protein LUG50_11590 [Planctomycetaceae bacterium]|nr:hypothetical protein [Planctomycetaceae bacterium]